MIIAGEFLIPSFLNDTKERQVFVSYSFLIVYIFLTLVFKEHHLHPVQRERLPETICH